MRPSNFHALKQALWKYAPPLFYLGRFIRRSLHERREGQIARELAPIKQAFAARHGAVVQGGPFKGMRYLARAYASPFLPKLIGCYEAEIHEAINTVLEEEYSLMVDIGCDEGYYAVGLLLRAPKSTMYAFDIDATARQACHELARLNGVGERLVLDGECTWSKLNEVLHPKALVISDCEGCELQLLDPLKVPGLRSADIIVELHDHERLDVRMSSVILGRFQDTHDIKVFDRCRRDPADYPSLAFLGQKQRALAMHENRMPTQQWALLRARN